MRIAAVLVGVASVVGASSASARTIVVSRYGGDFSGIQQAIDAAEGGDVVEVSLDDWVLDEPLDFRGKAIAVKGRERWAWARSTLRMSATPRDPNRACVVFFGSRETESSVLEGFDIEGGPGYWGLGGAIYCDEPASPTIRDCTVLHSREASHAVVLAGTARLQGCTISDTIGRAVYCRNGSRPTISGCEIRGNARRKPGDCAVYLDDGSELSLVSSLVVDNQGDGIYCGEGAGSKLALRYATVAGNGGAGIRVGPASKIALDGAIVWGNAGGSIRLEPGAEARVVRSIVEGPGIWPGEGNSAADPLFAAPAILDWSGTDWYGKPHFTARPGDYRVLPGSPALDAGDPSAAPETDVTGRARTCGEAPDIGAHETCEALRRFRRGDANADGIVDVSDGPWVLILLFLGASSCLGSWCFEPPCAEAADANDDGGVNITDGIFVLNWLFLGGPSPPDPGPFRCGTSPWDSGHDLGCDRYPDC